MGVCASGRVLYSLGSAAFSRTRLRHLVTLAISRRIQILLLTYLLTYLPINKSRSSLVVAIDLRRFGTHNDCAVHAAIAISTMSLILRTTYNNT